MALETLDDLLAPVAAADFFARSHEREPLHVARDRADHYANLFTLGDVDALLRFGRTPVAVASVDGNGRQSRRTPIGPDQVGRATAAGEAFAAGESLILYHAQDHWPTFAPLVRLVEETFRSPGNVNLYLTPGGRSGFVPHYDDHDVFVLQLAGTKTWRLWPPVVELPLEGPALPTPSPTGKPRELRLAAGDLLYLPRGWIHAAEAAEGASLHASLSVYARSWATVIARALTRVATEHVALRRAPAWPTADAIASRPELADEWRALLRLVADEADLGAACAALDRELLAKMQPHADGHFAELDAVATLDGRTRVERRPGLPCLVTATATQAILRFPGNEIAGPPYVREAYEFVARVTEPFTVAALPGPLTDEARVVLARRLVRAGLLRRARS